MSIFSWRPSQRRCLAWHVGVFIAYLLLAIILTFPVAFHLTTHIPIAHQIPGWMPGDGDPWHSLWMFWFVKHSLVDLGRLPFSTDLLFYPRGMELTYLSLIALPLLLSVPLVQLVGLIMTYNLLVLLSLAGAGYGTFLLVHYLTQDRGIAFIAGLVFAFSPYHMAHALEHLFLLMGAPWVPLYILFFIRSLGEGKRADLALASGFFLLTLLSNPYYPVYLMLFTAFYGVLQIWWAEDTRSRMCQLRRFARLTACTITVSLPVVAPVLLVDWGGTSLYPSLAEASVWSADLLAFFVPSSFHPLWGARVGPIYERFSGNVFEQTVYIGYVVLALSLLAVIRASKAVTRTWVVMSIVFFVLSLGPFLRIAGADRFALGETEFRITMPFLLLHYVPIVGGLRAPNRFNVMLMLSLAVLIGYGLKYLVSRLRPRWGGKAGAALPWIIAAAILCEFAAVPFPILDARIPNVYQEIGRHTTSPGSLVELPLDMWIAKYQYYQTAHRMRRLVGFGPRPVPSLIEFGDGFPFIKVFKDPDRLWEFEGPSSQGDALRFVDTFDIDVIVLHREYLRLETAERLQQWLVEVFPVGRVEENDSLVALWMQRRSDQSFARESLRFHWDFGLSGFPPFLAEGWSLPEVAGDFTFAWAHGRESRLWVHLPFVTDMRLELRLFPIVWPGGPPQRVSIYVNEQWVGEIHLEEQRWEHYGLRLPKTVLASGLNTIRFVYRHTASPKDVLPGSIDTRNLAVAFDFISLRAE